MMKFEEPSFIQETKLQYQKTTTVLCEGVLAKARDRLILICDLCSKEFTAIKCCHFANKKKRHDERDLCESCKVKVTSVNRYGTASPNQSGIVKQRQKKTTKEYKDGRFYNIRKTGSDEELNKLKSEKMKKQNQDPAFIRKIKEGQQLARQDPAKFVISNEERQRRRERRILANQQQWNTPEYREKMATVRYRVSKFQAQLFQEMKKQDSYWILEYPVPDSPYTVDLCNTKTKEIIECYGDYWHCNPKRFSADYYHRIVHKTAKEIWEYDIRRQRDLEKLGYIVSIVWESDAPFFFK